MRAVRIHAPGGPEALRLEDLPDPRPGAGEALVRVRAAGVNFIDIYQRKGLYSVPLPRVLGLEGAGVIEAIGPGVSDLAPGARVAWAGVPGSCAELCAAPVERLVSVPDALDLDLAAAVMLQGITAQFLATACYPLAPGHTCLIHAAAGGVGLLFCQIAKARGARVFGTVSTEQKARLAREAGADEAIIYTERDFEAEARRLTGGRGVDVVYDSVGRATFEKSLGALARRGMLVLFGQSSGPVPPFDPQVLAQKGSLFLTRPIIFDYTATREELCERAKEVLGAVAEGRLRVRIDEIFPLERAADAHRKLEGRKSAGKLLLVP